MSTTLSGATLHTSRQKEADYVRCGVVGVVWCGVVGVGYKKASQLTRLIVTVYNV